MTDDYDFRASERRRARELDELEARRLRARERQRAQLRAAHRRRRLTVLAVLGLVIGVASGAWVLDERHAQGASPVVPVKVVGAARKPVARSMPAVTRGVHVSAPWAEHVAGNLDRVLATPGLNLIEIDVKDENGEVSGLGRRTPALARRYGAERDYYDLAHVVRHRARPSHLGRRPHRQLQGPDRRRARPGDRDPRRVRRHLARRRRHALAQPVQPERLERT